MRYVIAKALDSPLRLRRSVHGAAPSYYFAGDADMNSLVSYSTWSGATKAAALYGGVVVPA